jgi:hypothetical protein
MVYGWTIDVALAESGNSRWLALAAPNDASVIP